MNGPLAEREDTYYRQWMELGGESRSRRWSKRRAMFWGLLQSGDHDSAYERGRAAGPRIGQNLVAVSGADLDLSWFFAKAVVAELFLVRRRGQQYSIVERPGDTWAPILLRLARSLDLGVLDPALPLALPPRAPLVAAGSAELLEIARGMFGEEAVAAVEDVLASDGMAAREFRLALTRGDTAATRHWHDREWSLWAKERSRVAVEERQGYACACCGQSGLKLQLNHRQKVRDWGRSVPENLEALCLPCHSSTDRRGIRCHGG